MCIDLPYNNIFDEQINDEIFEQINDEPFDEQTIQEQIAQ